METKFVIVGISESGYLSFDFDSFEPEIRSAVKFDTKEEAVKYVQKNLYGYYSVQEILVNI